QLDGKRVCEDPLDLRRLPRAAKIIAARSIDFEESELPGLLISTSDLSIDYRDESSGDEEGSEIESAPASESDSSGESGSDIELESDIEPEAPDSEANMNERSVYVGEDSNYCADMSPQLTGDTREATFLDMSPIEGPLQALISTSTLWSPDQSPSVSPAQEHRPNG
ncbi:hypothetical protein FOZ63_017640, partial [Perkinsus olseni]